MDKRLGQVEFIADKHEYWYTECGTHRRLHGVTAVIGKLLGKVFPDTDTVKVATIYGHDVHTESEHWIKEGKEPSTEAGKWLVQMLKDMRAELHIVKYEAELLVSDFEATASCIDIVGHTESGKVVLFDIKTTSLFDRAYCSMQLSCYKKLYELCYGSSVESMFVLATKPRRRFRILEQSDRAEKILSLNKGLP